MEVRFDLHIHSERSRRTGVCPDDRRARAGFRGVAVCDHDRALTETWDAPDFLLIPGIELSTDQGHLLGLFVTEQIEARELGAAIDAVHACGGLAVMAHPFERSCDAQRLDAYLDRLDGIEVWNGRADRKNPQANAMACALAQRAQKPVTAGSDAHLPEEIGNGVVTLEVDALTLPAVRAALLRGATAVDGRRGKARYVAESQLTKRRRTHAGAAAYAKPRSCRKVLLWISRGKRRPIMSWIVKAGKQGKKIVKKLIMPAEKHYVGYTRRIERVQTTRRICAMTFDDGPMGLPASPDRFDGRTLTDVLLDTLAQYGARGSFDVIGDTSANYPDEAGKLGSAAWGGVRFDHYPDIHCDEQGGAEHNDRLIRRIMLAETTRSRIHGFGILFGKGKTVCIRRARISPRL